MSSVATLEVGVQSSTTESDIAEQDKLEIEVSNDGGTSWGPTHTVNVYVSELTAWVDVTDDFAWTPSMLADANFKVRMRYKQIGATATRIRVNYLAAKTLDMLIVENPSSAYDKVTDSYASFSYSETTGGFTVFGFARGFPYETTCPVGIRTSTISRVDFNMRYWANASTVGDRYRIVYYVDPSPTATVLVDWTSTGKPLDSYAWPDQPEPNDGVWDWTDISNMRFTVETDRVGGDPDAVFREYEAWVTVHYIRPTTMDERINQDAGWCVFSALTWGKYPGVAGSGTLATVEFEVLGYGDTILDIYNPGMFLIGIDPYTNPYVARWTSIMFTPENGYFRNTIPGDIQGDPDGTPPDGDVDTYDFFAFATRYGSHEGDPNYNPLADLQGDTPGSLPDGDVDRYDFFAFATNYGRSI